MKEFSATLMLYRLKSSLNSYSQHYWPWQNYYNRIIQSPSYRLLNDFKSNSWVFTWITTVEHIAWLSKFLAALFSIVKSSNQLGWLKIGKWIKNGVYIHDSKSHKFKENGWMKPFSQKIFCLYYFEILQSHKLCMDV